MNTSYLNLIADYGGDAITHIGLWDSVTDAEVSGGDYARLPVTWEDAESGIIRPTADLVFDVPSGASVGGWRGFSALSGGTNYGGADFAAAEAFDGAGEYTLYSAGTAIVHESEGAEEGS
jgi:hypothetical protein